jgi:hypothetical protein
VGRQTVDASVREGKHNCLAYALQQGAHRITPPATAAATRLKLLILAHNHEVPWEVEACIAAVKASKLNCLKYLHEHGCTRDAGTTYAAAVGGELDCLQYAHEHDCPCIVVQLLAVRLTVRSRRCLEYVRRRSAAER